jgi:hypothetical protein
MPWDLGRLCVTVVSALKDFFVVLKRKIKEGQPSLLIYTDGSKSESGVKYAFITANHIITQKNNGPKDIYLPC